MTRLVLLDAKGKKVLVEPAEGMVTLPRVGVLDSDRLVEAVGRVLNVGGAEFLVLPARGPDLTDAMERGPQTLGRKDGASIISKCGIVGGDLVLEGGSGSGSMTIQLAAAVAPGGRVVSYDSKERHGNLARANVDRAVLLDIVQFKVADVTEGFEERDAAAVVLDIPNPWDALRPAYEALAVGGCLASFSPTANQVERTVNTLRALPFVLISTHETIEREMVVGEGGVRPSFDALGHTGYVTVARKALERL
jgi:tRNA (adenine57-N1/adenine58-N1)-methyltransferase